MQGNPSPEAVAAAAAINRRFIEAFGPPSPERPWPLDCFDEPLAEIIDDAFRGKLEGAVQGERDRIFELIRTPNAH